jgi:hypothetical protein
MICAWDQTPNAGVFQTNVWGAVERSPTALSWSAWCRIWMARTVFHAWSPQRRHTQQRTTILNVPRGHTPPVGTNEVDAMPTSDRQRFASSRESMGGSSKPRVAIKEDTNGGRQLSTRGRPLINDYPSERRSGHSPLDILMEGPE